MKQRHGIEKTGAALRRPLSRTAPETRGKRGDRRSDGFSLVEVLVAATILGITVIAIVAMVQKSGDLRAEGERRAAARTFIATKFEAEYGNERYAVVTVPPNNPDTVSFGNPAEGKNYPGILHTTITTAGGAIPYKEVTLSLDWNNPDDSRDTIALTKWLVQ